MNKIFSENLPWKIVSLVLATVLWLFVINSQNPTQPQEVKNIPVTIVGLDQLEEAGYILKNKEEIKNQNFRVIVKGPRLETDKYVKDPKLITVTLDVSTYINDITGDSLQAVAEYKTSINLEGHSASITVKSPGVNKVIIEKEAVVTKPITYALSDDIRASYTLLDDPIISPQEIEIRGASSDIERIATVMVNIDEKSFSADELVHNLPVMVLDKDGTEVSNLVLSQDEVQVRLLIGKEKTVPVKANFEGEVSDEYVLVDTSLSTNEVTIVGKESNIGNIGEIQLKPINLSELVETSEIEVEMILPDGVVTTTESKVKVMVEIARKSSYTYVIPISKLDLSVINVPDNMDYQLLDDTIEITLLGAGNELKYNNQEIKGTLDLAMAVEGEQGLPLKITVPENCEIVDDTIMVKVKLTAKEGEREEAVPEKTVPEETGSSEVIQSSEEDDTQIAVEE